ncbi:MAG: HEPN domain-containing protein [Elusimicrobia bacterium]|nr:HEPN domain-containing protein [Elusimicrobiota bacterium]
MGSENEARRWLRQSEADLKAARDSFKARNYEWSCFQSQQSGEKALKAYLYSLGFTSQMSHSAKLLVNKCIGKEKGFLKAKAAASWLDNYYIPTRYPNGLDGEVAPADYYEKEDAQKCIKYAALILGTVKRFIRI